MTGDSLSNEDADFLDEDFVIEDLVGKNDDLEDLFDKPTHPQADSAAKDDEAEGDSDEDEMLFSDHTEGIEATEQFAKPVFAEDGENEWDGDNLDLESVGVPDADVDGDEEPRDLEVDDAKELFATELDSLLHEEEGFALDSEAELELVKLPSESESDDGVSEFEQSGPFVLDDGDELWADELADEGTADVDAAPAETTQEAVDYEVVSQQVPGEDDGFEEFELGVDASLPELVSTDDQGCDTFDLELDATDDKGVRQAEVQAEELEGEGIKLVSAVDQMVTDAFGTGQGDASDQPLATSDADEMDFDDDSLDTMELRNAAAFASGSLLGEAGWEPLPATSMDELSEVDEVQRTDEVEYDVSGYEDDEADPLDEDGYEDSEEYGGQYAVETDLEDVAGHDLYAEDGADMRGVILGGPGQRRNTASLLVSVAASLLVLFGAAMVVVRPELFGLSVEPEHVAKVDVARPRVEVAVLEPPKVALQDEVISQPATGPTKPETVQSETVPPETSQPVAVEPVPPEPVPTEPTTTPANPQPHIVPTPSLPDGAKPVEIEVTQSAEVIASSGSDPTQAPTTGEAKGGVNAWPVAEAPNDRAPVGKKSSLTRFGDGLMVGGVAKRRVAAKAIDGVMPGSRAFAQLHNGNYFIGKVKNVADEVITLRVETGEVTLATEEIATLTRLGTTDYDELQKATKGFVRLTNNNRLVGGILSRIADDHVVLEFRSNRVMLPKSAIGEIVSGRSSDGKVRLGTTSEEDHWIRSLAERQLGTGQGAPMEPGISTPPVRSQPLR